MTEGLWVGWLRWLGLLPPPEPSRGRRWADRSSVEESPSPVIEEAAPPWLELMASPSMDGNVVRASILQDLLRELDSRSGPMVSDKSPDIRFLSALVRCMGSTRLELPVFPDVSLKLDRLLRSPDPDLQEVVALVAREPDLLRRVWSSASSALYARGVSDLDHAVARIGFDALWRIGMSVCLHSPVFRVGRYQSRVERIRARGEVAGSVCAWICDEPRGDAYLAGMLSEAGALFILRAAAQAGREPPCSELVQKVIRRHQAGLGVLMAHAWGLGDRVAAGIGYFSNPDAAPVPMQDMARCTRIAVIATLTAEEARLGRDIGGLRALEPYNGRFCDAAATIRRAGRAWRGAEPDEVDGVPAAQIA